MEARKPSLGAIFLTICLDLLGFSLALPFLAEVARTTFHVSSFVGTLLASSYSLMQFLFVPLWGRLSDRVGRKPVLAWSVAATIFANVCLGLTLAYAQNIAWVFAARMLAGFATANIGTASAYIADVTSRRDRAKGMTLIGLGFGVGFTLGPAFGGWLAQITINGRHGPVALFAAAGLSVVNLVWVVLGLVESLPKEKRKKSTRRFTTIDFGATGRVLADSSIARAILANFILILSFSAMEQTLRFFNKDAFAMTLADTGKLLALVGVTAALVQGLIVRRLSGRVPDATMLRLGIAVQVIAFAAISASPMFGRRALYAACVLLAAGNGMSQPASSAYVSKCARDDEQGETLGVSQSMSSLARVFGPALGGLAYDAISIRSPYTLACIGMAIALVIAFPLRDRVHSTSTQIS